ncbi:MAG: ABC transporter [Bacteroidales bacterium]|nr:ABC transporter [Bacteroidales bacterium]
MMKTIYNIAKNELRQLFYSPIAWILLVIFFVQCGAAFSEVMSMLLRVKLLGHGLSVVTNQIFIDNWNGVFPNIQGYLFIYIPLLTMGIMSREKTTGTDRLLLSSPVSETQIVLGKFLSMVFYGFIMLSGLLIQALLCCVVVKDIDAGPVFSGLLGLYLLLLAYSAIGIFMSSLTRYQIIAAVGTIAALFGLNYLTTVGQGIPVVREIAFWVGISGRASTFIRGMICSEDVIYFLTIIALFLSLTILRLQGEAVRSTRKVMTLKYIAVIVLFCGIGFASSRPVFKFYLDTTRTKSNTLTVESQKVMEKLDGPMTITTYVNLLGNDMYNGLPRNYTRDVSRFDWYTRFKPEIKMKYVYYWHPSQSYPINNKKFEGLDSLQKAEKMAKIHKVDFDKFLSPDQMADMIAELDLQTEDFRFLRVIEGGPHGRTARLRIYEDNERHPGEREITAAMKRLYEDVPKVGVLYGHDERDIFNIGDKGYFTFASSYVFRHALVNQGFDVEMVSLAEADVPEDISILLIADPKSHYTAEELARIEKYIENGGNLFIAAKPYNRQYITPVMEMTGLDFMDGILVQESKLYAQDLIVGDISKQADLVSPGYAMYRLKKNKVAGLSTMGIITDGAAEKGFNVLEISTTDSLVTDSTRVWNELQVVDFENNKATFDPATGERLLKKQPIAVALDRMVGQKKQSIVVIGNADMIANGELMMNRTGIPAANYCLISESFHYLTDGNFPIYAGRPASPDTDIYLKQGAKDWIKWIFNGILPGIIALLGIFILIRRKSR